jgi:hypothetical protein
MDIYLFHCVHEDEHIRTHDASLLPISKFHVTYEHAHKLPSSTLESSWKQINVVASY